MHEIVRETFKGSINKEKPIDALMKNPNESLGIHVLASEQGASEPTQNSTRREAKETRGKRTAWQTQGGIKVNQKPSDVKLNLPNTLLFSDEDFKASLISSSKANK